MIFKVSWTVLIILRKSSTISFCWSNLRDDDGSMGLPVVHFGLNFVDLRDELLLGVLEEGLAEPLLAAELVLGVFFELVHLPDPLALLVVDALRDLRGLVLDPVEHHLLVLDARLLLVLEVLEQH